MPMCSQSLFLGEIFLSDHPGINREVAVCGVFVPVQNEEFIKAKFMFPDYTKFISGDSVWTGFAMEGQILHFTSNIIFTDTGNCKIQLIVEKKYDGNKWTGNSFSYYLYVGDEKGNKGWNYYNDTERKLIERDSVGFFNRKYYDVDYINKDSVLENNNY